MCSSSARLRRPRLAIAILLAGEIVDPAERLALTAEGTDWDRAYKIARSAVEHAHVRDLMRAGRQRAEDILAANVELNERIVGALVERGSLTGAEINQLQEERQPAA